MLNVCAGWAVFSALQRGGSDGIPLAQFAEWWADEDQADGLRLYITTNAFPGAQLVERCVPVCVCLCWPSRCFKVVGIGLQLTLYVCVCLRVCVSVCVFRHGSKLYFHLPPQTVPLSVMFGRLEHAKTQLNILEYSLSQTTLEQVCDG